ncbi:MAG: TfoX/Sxy family protein [Elusimicrobiaceae bacterium]|nr:TfoX/Sxy family protein [Elusimicrobiaceae bacterium]
MASNIEFVQYVCEQIDKAGFISYRMMFGDYCIYCDKKPVALVCDNQFFVKVTPEGEKAFPSMPKAAPYPGAKLYLLVEDVDDAKTAARLVKLTAKQIPLPKKRAQ